MDASSTVVELKTATLIAVDLCSGCFIVEVLLLLPPHSITSTKLATEIGGAILKIAYSAL